jgi:F-type H+-transporting ATPase subunit delta
MAAKGKKESAATQYALALLDLATAKGLAQQIGEEIAALKQIVQGNRTFELFLKDPGVGTAEKRRVIDQAYAGRIHELLLNTLRVMNRNGRLGFVVAVADTYQRLLDAQLGNLKVEVTVASKLDPAMLEQVQQRVSQALKKNAIVTQKVDESIIGGLVLQVEDKLIDGSVKKQLELMRKKLLTAAP